MSVARLAAFAIVCTFTGIWSYLATANGNAVVRLHDIKLGSGITSPVADCEPFLGCYSGSDRNSILYLQLLSANALMVAFNGDLPIEVPLTNYLLSEVSHEGTPSPVTASLAGESRTVVGFTRTTEYPLTEQRIHLHFPIAMKHNKSYRLHVKDKPGLAINFTFSDKFISPSIQVNQVGYLPGSRKVGIIGNWLGTAGPMPVASSHFEIIDQASGKIILRRPLSLVSKHDEWSGNRVYHADFTSVQRPGDYYLSAPGVGISHSFSINHDVYRAVSRHVFRLFYHSRNSIPILEKYSDRGFSRPSGIPSSLNGIVHPAIKRSPFDYEKNPGDKINISGGWFDAGDYGQYVVNAAPVWHAFSVGYDLSANVMNNDDMGLPESGNGQSDFIDELEWGMQWMRAMQDPGDGGVYSRLVPVNWDTQLPQDVETPRYLFEKTTHATASFAATLAIHARMLETVTDLGTQDLVTQAELAWDFITHQPSWPEEGDRYVNPHGVHAGEYPDKSSIDNRLWAAGELYRLTGNARYMQAFVALFNKIQVDPTALTSFKDQLLAACWALVMAEHEGKPVDEHTSEQVRKILLSSADWLIRMTDNHPYLAPMHHDLRFTGWGSFAHSTRAILPLLQAYALTKKQVYLDYAMQMSNPQLGTNPQSISYITGIGSRSPKYPLSKLSQFSGLNRPLTGIPVNGPHYHLPALWNSTRKVNSTYVPLEQRSDSAEKEGNAQITYPALRRYIDATPLPPMSEPTVAEYARTAIGLALLKQN